MALSLLFHRAVGPGSADGEGPPGPACRRRIVLFQSFEGRSHMGRPFFLPP